MRTPPERAMRAPTDEGGGSSPAPAGSHTPEARLAALDITLPPAPKPVASYVPWATSGNLLFVSGQIPVENGIPAFKGLVGRDVTVAQGAEAARLCAVNALAVVKAALGSLDRVRRVVRVGVFVACGADFDQHPKVANGASDLFVEVFGEAGRHARAAVGCPSLPLGVPVEVELIVETAPSA